MKIVIAHDTVIPALHYGGTERVLWWLSRGLKEAGHDVSLVVREGSTCPYGKVIVGNFKNNIETQLDFSFDVIHYFFTPPETPKSPYLVTIHGNGQPGETFLPNTLFLSRNHAERHGGEHFVYNGIDPDEYEFRSQKSDYFLFLAKARWRAKNVRGASRIASKVGTPLQIIGGNRPWWSFSRNNLWHGFIGGDEKKAVVSRAKALLFPVLWDEPFGLAVVESLVSGTPVLASPFGSLPELVPDTVGFLCNSETEFVERAEKLKQISPMACREWVLTNFHYRVMTENYLKYYERAKKKRLHSHSLAGIQRAKPLYQLKN